MGHRVRLTLSCSSLLFFLLVHLINFDFGFIVSTVQDPADGFYRKRKKDFSNSKDILDLVGIAVPCECNNRSKICHKETGVCQASIPSKLG